jgi:hypothetical protein
MAPRKHAESVAEDLSLVGNITAVGQVAATDDDLRYVYP